MEVAVPTKASYSGLIKVRSGVIRSARVCGRTKEAMQEVPAWPSELCYTGVLFCGHQPYDRRPHGHHPPPVPVLGVRAGADRQGVRLTCALTSGPAWRFTSLGARHKVDREVKRNVGQLGYLPLIDVAMS